MADQDDGYLNAMMTLLRDPRRAGYAMANGAGNQLDMAKWALGGMNGAPPPVYDGRLTPNQVVDLNFPPRGGYINRQFGDKDYINQTGAFGSLAPQGR